MSLSEKASSRKPRKLPTQGLQPARCYAVIDLGTQTGTYKGQPKEPSLEVLFLWELAKFMITYKEGEAPVPSMVKQQYTFSTGAKAKLPGVLKSWAGDKMKKRPEKIGPDLLKKFVGLPCMITIVHSEDGQWANVGDGGRAVAPPMAEIPVPKLHNAPIFFNLDEFTWDKFKALPEFVQKMIRKSAEFPKICSKSPEPISADIAISSTDGMEDEEGSIVGFEDSDTPDEF